MNNDFFPGWDSIPDADLSESKINWDFKRVLTKAKAQEERSQRKFLWQSNRRKVFYSVAAAFVSILLVLSGALISNHFRAPQTVVADNIEYTTAKGEMKEIILPDDSKVVLNSGSVLICPKEFGKTRSVYLMGEAIFDVTASDTEPFFVNTSEMRILVHGTRFNVKAYFDDDYVRTTLCRGAIDTWPSSDASRRLALAPGQTLTYNKEDGSMIVSRGLASEATSWESGDLCFRSESLSGIIRILERHFNVSMYLTTDKFDDAVITASFVNGESLQDLLKAISAVVPGMKYSIHGDKVYLK